MVKVVVEVSGGIVQAVYADEPQGVDVTVLDWDEIRETDAEAPEGLTTGMTQVY